MEWYYVALIVLGSLVVLWFVAIFVVFVIAFKRFNETEINNLYSPQMEKFVPELKRAKVVFRSKNPEIVEVTAPDGVVLKAFYLKNDVPTKRTAILLHGYRGNATERMPDSFEFMNMGFNVLLPYVRGHGLSQGKFIGMAVSESRDLLTWIDYITARDGQDATFLLSGISMGAAIVATVSGESDLPSSVKVIFCDSAYTSVYDELNTLLKSVHIIQPFRFLAIKTAEMYSKLFAGYGYNEHTPLQAVRRSHTPTLFVHGLSDGFVSCEMGKHLYQECSAPKDIVLVEDADHCLAYLINPQLVMSKMKQFVEKYM